jgi:hypothetical protein
MPTTNLSIGIAVVFILTSFTLQGQNDSSLSKAKHLIDNCSPGNDSQCNPSGSCTSFEAGHELGNDDGIHACQAEVHYPNPEIQID